MNSLFDFKELGVKVKHNVEKANVGLNYIGGKRKLAKFLFDTMLDDSQIENPVFYDIFGGGAAMSFQSLFLGWETYYNDLNTDLYLFFRDLHELNKPENIKFFMDNFFDRKLYNFWRDNDEEKFALRTLILTCYSYGGTMIQYTYGHDNEVFKKYAHFAISQADKKSFEFIWCYYMPRLNYNYKICNMWLDFGDYMAKIDSWRERSLAYDSFLTKMESISATKTWDIWDEKLKKISKKEGKSYFEIFVEMPQSDIMRVYKELNEQGWDIKPRESGKSYSMKKLNELENYLNYCIVKHFKSLNNIMNLIKVGNYDKMHCSNCSFENMEIKHKPSECIIYCDPPYDMVDGLGIGDRLYSQNRNVEKFPFERFYDWVRDLSKQGYNVYVSEYKAPSDFKIIYEKDYKSVVTAKANAKVVQERLFKYEG